MNNINLKNIIKKFSESGGKDKLKSILTPHRDWKIIVVTFFLSFIVLIAANMYFFTQINNEKIFFKAEEGEVEDFEVLDVLGLKETIEFFENKENKFNTLVEEKFEIVDPSL